MFERFYKEIKLLILDNFNSTIATIWNSPIFMTAFTYVIYDCKFNISNSYPWLEGGGGNEIFGTELLWIGIIRVPIIEKNQRSVQGIKRWKGAERTFGQARNYSQERDNLQFLGTRKPPYVTEKICELRKSNLYIFLHF